MKTLTLILLLAGCGDLPAPPPAPDGGKREVVEPELYDDSEDGFGGLGSLPIGYNQRQCQWDACGGPLPNQPNPAINPQPDQEAR